MFVFEWFVLPSSRNVRHKIDLITPSAVGCNRVSRTIVTLFGTSLALPCSKRFFYNAAVILIMPL
jgi:hypothetical protein